MKRQTSMSRRRFLQVVAASSASAGWSRSVLSRPLGAVASNGKLRTAHIGVGGMGGADLQSIASHPAVEVAALCDIDTRNLERAKGSHASAAIYRDYREMLTALGDRIDAVIVSTPDHTHAPAAMTALQLGKPVYCQKPLTHQVYEARQLSKVAAEKRLVTQMGIQVHASQEYRTAVGLVQGGLVGKVSRVHAWSSKNWGFDGPAPTAAQDPPSEVDWNLWLGTAAQRPYHDGFYHAANWRKLIDFGTGTLGDMGVHIFDTPYRALELTAPSWVETSCRPPTGFGHPEKNRVTYEFPGTRYTTEKLSWIWSDGAQAPPTAEELGLPAGTAVPDQGSLFAGDAGVLLLPHVSMPRVFREGREIGLKVDPLPPIDHYHQFVDACLGQAQTSAHFGYAGPLTESLLLGVVANRYPGERLQWDSPQFQLTNLAVANELLRRPYRAGFEVVGLS